MQGSPRNYTEVAKARIKRGLSVVPIPNKWEDFNNKPINFKWKTYQEKRMSVTASESIFSEVYGIAVICGKVSGNLICFDFDRENYFEKWLELIADLIGPQFHKKLIIEKTPKGFGRHVFVRFPKPPPPNQKLASHITEDGELLVAIETRGEGGLVYTAPTEGYELLQGEIENAPVITAEQASRMLEAAKALCMAPEPEQPEPQTRAASNSGTIKPGDHFNEKAEWKDILEPHGHVYIKSSNGIQLWRRKGKKGKAPSFTVGIGNNKDLMRCFTSNASPLKQDTTYTKFGAYTELEHGGDWSAAAKAIIKKYNLKPPKQNNSDTNTNNTVVLSIERGAESLIEYSLTDVGNAERLAVTMAGDYKWVGDAKAWYIYDGNKYIKDDSEQLATRLAIEMTRILHAQAIDRGGDIADQMKPYAKKCENNARISAMINLVKALPGVSAKSSDFDNNDYEINVENGILNLRNLKLRERSNKDLVTKIANVTYNPDYLLETPELFEKQLDFMFQNEHEDLRYWLIRFAGYSLSGDTTLRKFAFLEGVSGAGKTTFMNILMGIMGDYAENLPMDALMDIKFGGKEKYDDFASVAGTRLLHSSEMKSKSYFNKDLLKMITGEKSMKVRHLFSKWFEMKIQFKLWITGNSQPNVEGFDDALANRMGLVKFYNQIPANQYNPEIENLLQDEYDVIFAHLANQCKIALGSGLPDSDSITEAVNAYRSLMNRVGEFIKECLEEAGNYSQPSKAKDVYRRYESWCKGYNYGIENYKNFTKSMEDNGIKRIIHNRELSVYENVVLRDED